MEILKKEESVIITKEFKGDILITDPCYICKEPDKSLKPKWEDYMSYKTLKDYPDYSPEKPMSENKGSLFFKEYEKMREAEEKWKKENPDDWEKCGYGYAMEKLGITKYMTNSTLYGDWGCTVYEEDTNKVLGRFCADAGLVSVFDLEEVRRYNPAIDDQIAKLDWCFTVIKDFEGEISFVKVHVGGRYTADSPLWEKDGTWEDTYLTVKGKGNINFYTVQTSL